MAKSQCDEEDSNLRLTIIFWLQLKLDWSKFFDMDLTNLDSFRKQIAEAQTSIQQLFGFRRVVDDRIADLRDLIRANANFLPDQERHAELLSLEMLKVPETIAEAVTIALFIAKARNSRLTPTQIRDSAQERGFNFSTYTNPMASIHSILKRMKDANPPEVDFDESTGTYSYISALPTDVADEHFYDRLNERAMNRILADENQIANKVAGEVIDEFFAEITRKPRRKR